MSSQPSLFDTQSESPLAFKMRPHSVREVVGQKHFLNEAFYHMIDSDRWVSLLFWGPPGTGKTTLAWAISEQTLRPIQYLSAVLAGTKDLKEALDQSRKSLQSGQKAHLIFIDEIHRLNKAQQDVLLPYVEEGSAKCIGATTENPSFEINNALASRSLIFHFLPLNKEEILDILKKTSLSDKTIEPEVLEKIAESCLGDARRAWNLFEHLHSSTLDKHITLKNFEDLAHSQSLYFDKKSEGHYDTISAFIKSVRGSDPDAAIYYLARLIEGGEDPVFIARRLLILASEDIGNAQPLGLVLANSAFEAVHKIGMPEARIALAQVTTYLSCCEKSNRSYLAIDKAIETVKKTGNLEIPMHIRNAPTKQMKEWGYGKNYQYAHSDPRGWVEQDYLPAELKNIRFYEPSEHGTEKRLKELQQSRKLTQSNTSDN